MDHPSPKLALLAGALALGLSSAAWAEDDAKDKADAGPSAAMLANTCAGCHGTNGNSVGPASPSLANISEVVFIDMMERFKNGEIQSTIMGRIAKGYGTDDFEKMAGFFNAQTFIPAKQDFDAALVEKGAKLHENYCEECHAEGGKALPDEDEYYLLAGQWTPYLQFALEDFREERREMVKKMREKLGDMLENSGEESLTALTAYYASQQ